MPTFVLFVKVRRAQPPRAPLKRSTGGLGRPPLPLWHARRVQRAGGTARPRRERGAPRPRRPLPDAHLPRHLRCALCCVPCALTCSSLAPRRTRTHTPASSLPGRATPRACTALPMCWPAPQAELENVSEIVCPEGHAWCVDVKEAAGDEEKRGVWIDPNESTPLSGRYVRRTGRADGPA